MVTHIHKEESSGVTAIALVLIALLAFVVGFYIFNQREEESGVRLQLGDKEISATVTEEQ